LESRCNKLIFAALQATVDLHLNQSRAGIAAIGLLQVSRDELRARAAAIASRLEGLPLRIAIGCGTVKVGGGTLPKSTIPSVTIDLAPESCSLVDFAARLRTRR